MIPITDNHPTHHRPYFTWLMMAACIGIFGLQVGSPLGFEASVAIYGLIPAYTVGNELDPEALNVGWWGVISSMFLHGSVAHLAGNMLYLFVFGDNIENALYRTHEPLGGRARFALFYLLGGAAAALGHAYLDPLSDIPMIGASGAISAVLGGYLVLYPKQQITVALPYVGITELPAWAVLGSWFAYQLLYAAATEPGGAGVAFWAHIFGFVAGVILILPLGGRQRPVLWR
jgi:membrane associated rhomboid family serine protease